MLASNLLQINLAELHKKFKGILKKIKMSLLPNPLSLDFIVEIFDEKCLAQLRILEIFPLKFNAKATFFIKFRRLERTCH